MSIQRKLAAMPPVTLLSGFLGAGKTQRPAAVTIFESF